MNQKILQLIFLFTSISVASYSQDTIRSCTFDLNNSDNTLENIQLRTFDEVLIYGKYLDTRSNNILEFHRYHDDFIVYEILNEDIIVKSGLYKNTKTPVSIDEFGKYCFIYLKHGEWKKFDQHGNLEYSAVFENGNQIGTRHYYRKDGLKHLIDYGSNQNTQQTTRQKDTLVE